MTQTWKPLVLKAGAAMFVCSAFLYVVLYPRLTGAWATFTLAAIYVLAFVGTPILLVAPLLWNQEEEAAEESALREGELLENHLRIYE